MGNKSAVLFTGSHKDHEDFPLNYPEPGARGVVIDTLEFEDSIYVKARFEEEYMCDMWLFPCQYVWEEDVKNANDRGQ